VLDTVYILVNLHSTSFLFFFLSGDSAVYIKPREHQNIIVNKSYSLKSLDFH